MKKLILTPEDYIQINRGFAGGFTHANVMYSGEIVYNVYSKDFTSSYPAVMLCKKFPMTSPKLIKLNSKEEFDIYLKTYCCIFDIEFYDIEPLFYFENYISKSHCTKYENMEENNGRVVRASYLKTTITEQDYFIIEKFYTWKNCKITNFRVMRKAYLPKNFIIPILDLYELKTTLKGVEGRELDYLLSKERINSEFGMCVTDICRNEIDYSPLEWTSKKPDIDKAIDKNNKSIKRFLYYPWGVWITAYARVNLFTAIYELKEDYVYSDTDSVKYINHEKHEKYFNSYNNNVIKELKRAMEFHNIDFERTRPKNIKGEIKQIGIWDDEGMYSRFKTLGAKRYMTEKDNKISITVSGLNKNIAVPYLLDTYGDKIFEQFDNNLYIPKGYTGKQTHTYLDEEYEGYIEDYQGNVAYYKELSGIHLENADYSLSISDTYIKYLLGYKDGEE